MILFPAIDLKNGQCVRLEQGDMARATVFNLDPAAQARDFETQGFEYLHVVDLDGAFAGKPVNAQAVESMLKVIKMPVQLGGGIRDLKTVEAWLSKGITRVIIGTAAVRDPALVKEVLGEDTAYDRYTITFNRLLLYRIIFPFFMIAMVLLLCFLPLFTERDSLIDVSAAMLFGIFGLKGIIGPGDQMGQTVMDIALIGLYVLLAFAVLMFFIRRLMSQPAES